MCDEKASDFDWDDISIGEPALNTSGNFFYRDVKIENGVKSESECAASSSASENGSERNPSETATEDHYQWQVPVWLQAKVRQAEPYDRAYRYARAYEDKRKALREMEERREKQLQEKKKFHARPAPNYNHGAKKENVEPKITIPVTPKHTKPERMKKAAVQVRKLEETTEDPVPSMECKEYDAKVLADEPFNPAPIKTETPFNLKMSFRLQERQWAKDGKASR